MTLDALLEAALFAAARPLRLKQLSEITHAASEDVVEALGALERRLDAAQSGVMLQQNGQAVELVTRPEASDVVATIARAETHDELTRAALEVLSILAYCGPMTQPELEQIRGVHSSVMLRALLMRGLVEEKEEERLGQPMYAVTFQFLHHLGIPSIKGLPEYEALRGHETVVDVLGQLERAPV